MLIPSVADSTPAGMSLLRLISPVLLAALLAIGGCSPDDQLAGGGSDDSTPASAASPTSDSAPSDSSDDDTSRDAASADSPDAAPNGSQAAADTSGSDAPSPDGPTPRTGTGPNTDTATTDSADHRSGEPDGGSAPDGADAALPSGASASGESEANGNESSSATVNADLPRSGKEKVDPDFDPIKENGPIFVGWPKPELAIVFTGRLDGYIEPCGCAGLEKMKGGMSRRHSLFKNMRQQRDWPTIGLDVGGIAKGYGRQSEIKFQIMVDGMRQMEYDAITLGKSDLRLPAAELLTVAADTAEQKTPFLSANVGLFGFDAGLTATSRLIEAGGMTIGVTGVLGESYRKAVNNAEVEIISPEEGIRRVLPELLEKSNLQILLAHASVEESVALSKEFPEFDVVVTAGGAPEPPAAPRTIEGSDALLIEVGEKGMNATVLGLYDDPQQPWRYQRVPLDSRFPRSEPMHLLLTAYQNQLKQLGWEGLGLRPVPHPLRERNGKFVGSKECRNCHEPSYDIWKDSGHGKAWRTLVELEPQRIHDPECVSCHVIGWHPTKYFPYQSGFVNYEETPHLKDTGCETCHGPGELHVRAETYGTEEEREKYRKAVVVTKEESEAGQCVSCHDLDNSPEFEFKTYWPKVEHYE